MNTTIKVLVSLLLAVSLSSCGFYLRGSAQVAERWNPIYVQSGKLQAEQLRLLNRALLKASARLTSDRDAANRLYVVIHPLQSSLLASSSPTDVELRQLSMRLEYRLESSTGELLLESQQLERSRELELERSNVLAASELIDTVAEDLQDELIRGLVMSLGQR